MFKFFSNYKKIKEDIHRLTLENANLILKLEKFSEADQKLLKVLEAKRDLEPIDLSTETNRREVAAKARSILNNDLFKKMINNSRYDLIMKSVRESRDYPELVQNRANLLFIENNIIGQLIKFAGGDKEDNKGKQDDF